jgi:hypothetical protein
MSGSSGLPVIACKPKAKHRFQAAAILLFYALQKNHLNKLYLFQNRNQFLEELKKTTKNPETHCLRTEIRHQDLHSNMNK